MAYAELLDELMRQIVKRCAPEKVFLFGSYAKGVIRKGSDIDLCIVVDTRDARKLKQDLQLSLDLETALDIVIYTPSVWTEQVGDPASFAHQIASKGVLLYGGQ